MEEIDNALLWREEWSPSKNRGGAIKSTNGSWSLIEIGTFYPQLAGGGQRVWVQIVCRFGGRKMRNSIWYLYFFPNELWGSCQDWWGEEENIGDLWKKIEDIVWTNHLKAWIEVLNCAVCPTEICVGFKGKTANVVGYRYMFFCKHMKPLRDLVQAWGGCNSELNGVRGIY